MLSRFHPIPERYGQTDRIAINIARQYLQQSTFLLKTVSMIFAVFEVSF